MSDLEHVEILSTGHTAAERKHGLWRVRVSVTLTGVGAETVLTSQEHRAKTFHEACAKANAEVQAMADEIGQAAP